MTITTRRVTGPIVLPDGTVPRNGRVTYQLSGWDREGSEAVVMGPITVNLDGDGVFDDALWCTDTGENGRVYVGTVQWHDGTARQSLPIVFDVQSGSGDQAFVPSWVVGDLPESTQADALAQCLAAAAQASADRVSAQAAASAADASADATIAIGSTDAFLRLGDVISDPLLGTDANWSITGATATRAANKVYPVGKTISVSVPAATFVYLRSTTSPTFWVGATGLTDYFVEIDFTVTSGDIGTMYLRFDWNTTTGEYYHSPIYFADCLTRPFVVGQVMRARFHAVRPAGFTGTFASHEMYVYIGRSTDAARSIEIHRIAVQVATAEDLYAPKTSVMSASDLAKLTPTQIAVGDKVVAFDLGSTVFERVSTGGDLNFSGSGGVRLSVVSAPGAVPVEAFGAVRGPTLGTYVDSASALQNALNWAAAGIGRAVYFSGDYAISSTLTIPVGASVQSHRNSVLRPLPGSGPSIGIIASSGAMLGLNTLPQLAQFSSYGISIRGTDIAHIVVPQCHSCGCAIQIAATSADKNVLDTVVEFDAIANCGAVVEVSSESSDCVIQGLVIKGNFVTEATTFLRRTGVACADDGLEIHLHAIDFTVGGGAFCDNQIAAHSVPRPLVRIGSWIGGDGFTAATPTQLFKGLWDGAQIDICDAVLFDQTHLTPDLVRGSSWRIRASLAIGAAATLVPLGAALSGFNGGKMLCQTDFLAKITLSSALAAGSALNASFFHCLADGLYQRFDATMQQGASGVIVESVHDQSATVSGRVAVVLRNISGSSIASGTTLYIAVRRR